MCCAQPGGGRVVFFFLLMYFFEGPARASAGAPPANGLPLAPSMAASLLRMEVTFGRSVLDIPRGGRKNSQQKKCQSRAPAHHARSSSNEAFVEAFSMSSSTHAHRGRCAGHRVALQPRSSQRIPAGPEAGLATCKLGAGRELDDMLKAFDESLVT